MILFVKDTLTRKHLKLIHHRKHVKLVKYQGGFRFQTCGKIYYNVVCQKDPYLAHYSVHNNFDKTVFCVDENDISDLWKNGFFMKKEIEK